MWDSVRNTWVQFNQDLEGYLDFMYLDTRNLVTTGMGNLIDPRPVAERLNWYDERTGEYVSIDDIDAAWDLVKSRTDLSPLGGGAFKHVTSLRLTGEDINNLIFSKLDEMESYLQRRPPFRDYETWPADAQLALLSMAWGLGPAFNFPRFQAFASERRWREAATECRFTPDVGTIRVRNDRNQQCFNNAALVEDESGDPTQLLWPWHRMPPTDLHGFVCGLSEGGVLGELGLAVKGAFDVLIECPVDPSGYTGPLGGPNVGGHRPPQWYEQYGMDIGATPGTDVVAAFDGRVTVYHEHAPNPAHPGVYGDQIFARFPNNGMGCYYTHIQDVPDHLKRPGAEFTRGEFLGRVRLQPGIAPHLHHALMEDIGGQLVGVNLYNLYLDLETVYSKYAIPVRFMQDGSPPVIQWQRLEDEQLAKKKKQLAKQY